MRRFIALVVLALHVLFVWMLALGFRQRIDRVPEQPRLVSQWLYLPAVIMEPPPDRKPPPDIVKPRQPAAEPPPIAPPPVAPTAPVTAPLVPAAPEPQPESTAPVVAPTPRVDFAKAAQQAARNKVDAELAAERKAEISGTKPKALAGPCVPRKRSMEFKGNGDSPGLHWVGPLPVLVTKRCMFTLGVFSCVIGKLPEANGHLFDDMNDPESPRSSVPDPNKCD